MPWLATAPPLAASAVTGVRDSRVGVVRVGVDPDGVSVRVGVVRVGVSLRVGVGAGVVRVGVVVVGRG